MFSDYYPPFWKPDNLGLKEAKLSLDSKINSSNNDLVIEAILALDKIEFLEGTQNDSRANSLKTMIAFFRDENGKPVLPIKLRTKMDSFHIDLASLQSEFKGKMKLDIGTIVINILDKAKEKIGETTKDVKGATIDKTKNTIKGVVGVIDSVINGKKAEVATEQPTQPIEQQSQITAQPAQQEELTKPAIQTKTEESIPVQATESQQTNTQVQNATTNTQTNVPNQVPTQDTQANTESQNQNQPAQ